MFSNLFRKPKQKRAQSRKGVPISLRYAILKRDRFSCVDCGRSPATHHDVTLEIDHKVLVSHGGQTIEENLETRCKDCNLGKGPTSTGKHKSPRPVICSPFAGSTTRGKTTVHRSHSKNCGALKRTQPENLIYWKTVEDAEADGRTKCGLCFPGG